MMLRPWNLTRPGLFYVIGLWSHAWTLKGNQCNQYYIYYYYNLLTYCLDRRMIDLGAHEWSIYDYWSI